MSMGVPGLNLANRVLQVWAFANLNRKPPGGLLDKVAHMAERKMSTFSPQNTSNLLWCAPCYARARHLLPDFPPIFPISLRRTSIRSDLFARSYFSSFSVCFRLCIC